MMNINRRLYTCSIIVIFCKSWVKVELGFVKAKTLCAKTALCDTERDIEEVETRISIRGAMVSTGTLKQDKQAEVEILHKSSKNNN